ncbi:hypothetical protein [Fervidobacterium sp.]
MRAENLPKDAEQLKLVRQPESDPRVVERWKERLAVLADPQGHVLHATIGLHNNRPFYDGESRNLLKELLSRHVKRFVLKLELQRQPSGFIFAHGHLLLPWEPEALDFIKGMWASGAKNERVKYKNKKLPSAFSQVQNFSEIPDLSDLEVFVSFKDSTIAVLKASDDLAHYLAKKTYVGGLPSLIESLRL